MSAPWLIVVASLLFATMGVCVKLASVHYGSGEIVMYRGLIGAAMIAAFSGLRGETLKTAVPGKHALRSLSGVSALCLWFAAIATLPLATAMTLNYTSSLWLALCMVIGAAASGRGRVDGRLVLAVATGFAGVLLVLQPTIAAHQLGYGLVGLLSGLVSAASYLQVTALGRSGETEHRIVFYFSIGSALGGAVLAGLTGFTGWNAHSWRGVGLLVAVGVLATVAQLMLTRAYARGRTLVNASLQYLGIAFSFLYGVLLFGDTWNWLAAIGIVLIVMACVRATWLRRAPDADAVAAAAAAGPAVNPAAAGARR